MTETIQKNNKTGQNNDQTLFEDLERRYGPAMAQDILDQLKKAESIKKADKALVDYMGAKALSEASEIYRREAQIALGRYKMWQGACGKDLKGVIDMECAFLKKEFQRSFQFYRRFNKGFFITYRQAMQTYKTGQFVPGQEKTPIFNKKWDSTTKMAA